eukprot:ANDGO_05592.mRNA.1 hypothetical protein
MVDHMNFLIYLIPFLFYDLVVHPEFYQCFRDFSIGFFLASCTTLQEEDIVRMEYHFSRACQAFERLAGAAECRFAFHALLHVGMVTRRHGPLCHHWTFPLEAFIKESSALITAPNQAFSQLSDGLHHRLFLSEMECWLGNTSVWEHLESFRVTAQPRNTFIFRPHAKQYTHSGDVQFSESGMTVECATPLVTAAVMKWRSMFDPEYGPLYQKAVREFGRSNIATEEDLAYFARRIEVPCQDIICFHRVYCANHWGPLQLASFATSCPVQLFCNSTVSVMFSPKMYCKILKLFVCRSSPTNGVHLAFAQVQGFLRLPTHAVSGYAVVDVGKRWSQSNATELVPLHLIGAHIVLQEMMRGRAHLVLELSRHPTSIEGVGL